MERNTLSSAVYKQEAINSSFSIVNHKTAAIHHLTCITGVMWGLLEPFFSTHWVKAANIVGNTVSSQSQGTHNETPGETLALMGKTHKPHKKLVRLGS